MEVKEVITIRRSIRNYKNTPVPDEVLQDLLDAAMMAPSAVNLQPWYFVVVRSPEKIKKLAQIMSQVSCDLEPSLRERFKNNPEVADESLAFIREMGGAPICVLVFQHRATCLKTKSSIIQSVAAAIENFCLAADHGLGTCWMTAPIEANVGEELWREFAPDNGPMVAMLTLGYPRGVPKAPARKSGRYDIV